MKVYCETTLNYARGEDRAAIPVKIHDGRHALSDLPFEESGFTLINHESAVRSWTDEDEVSRVHCPEVAALAQQLTGCDRTVPYPPLVRSPETAASVEDYAPIEFVHSDFTDDYQRMVRDPTRAYATFLKPLLEAQGLSQDDVRQASRIAMIQFWRNIGAASPDYPFALCDARTTDRAQLGTVLVPEYGGQRLEFETFYANSLTGTGKHAWYTFPALQPDEVIALRTYDSRCEAEGRPFWTLHSAFRDPNAGPDAPQRESVEMRVLCLWD